MVHRFEDDERRLSVFFDREVQKSLSLWNPTLSASAQTDRSLAEERGEGKGGGGADAQPVTGAESASGISRRLW